MYSTNGRLLGLDGFEDVSLYEASRTYTFPGGVTYTITNPTHVLVRPSGSHRVVDLEGRSHCIRESWIALSWEPKDGAPAHFKF